MGGHGRVGFLEGSLSAPKRAFNLVCGATKRKQEDPIKPETPGKRRKRNERPVIPMVLHTEKGRHKVEVLLDTGCSIPLINQQTVEKLGIPVKGHKNPRVVENFTGETVKGAGQYYTKQLCLQHRRHFTNEQFEVSPMEKEIDIFLPFS